MTRREELTSELQQICARHEREIRGLATNPGSWTSSPNPEISRCLPDWAKRNFVRARGTAIPEGIYSEALRAYNSVWSR